MSQASAFHSSFDPADRHDLAEARRLVDEGRTHPARHILYARLARDPTDAGARSLLAEVNRLEGLKPDDGLPVDHVEMGTPWGIVLLAGLQFVGSALLGLFFVFALVRFVALFALLFLAMAAAFAALGVGLLRARAWAWWVQAAGNFMGVLVGLFASVSLVDHLVGFVVNGSVLAYLVVVRERFDIFGDRES